MTRTKRNRAQRARKRRQLSGSAKRTFRSRVGLKFGAAGALFLGAVGYFAAGDQFVELTKKWAGTVREATVSFYLSLPAVRENNVSALVESNFGQGVCAAKHDRIDLDRNGVSSDLVVTIVSLEISPSCEDWVQPAVAVFRNVGWSWIALDVVSVPMSGVQASWYNNYIFLEGGGNDTPGFALYGYEGEVLREIHSDHGELPSKEELFPYGDNTKLLISGRSYDVVVDFDHDSEIHTVDPIKFDTEGRSKKNVLTSVYTGDWFETYSFNGEILDTGKGTYKFSKWFGLLDLVYVPNHCDTSGLVKATNAPGFFRRTNPSVQARICCPIDIEDYGSCAEDTKEASDFESLVVELQPSSDD